MENVMIYIMENHILFSIVSENIIYLFYYLL